jgi:type VI secretion system protein ImpL
MGVDVMTTIILTLASAWPYVLMAIFVIILGILAYLCVVIRAAQLRPSPEDGEGVSLKGADDIQSEDVVAEKAPPASPLQLRQVFAESIQWLRANVGGRNYRYQIPWFMMIGEAGSGKTTVLGNTRMNLLPGQPAAFEDGAGQECGWWFFDKGIVLDIAGDLVVGGHGKRADEQGWHTLLALLQRHRPQRPLDGVIVTIPSTDLFGPLEFGAERLTLAAERADQLYQRLWQAQKTLGMCLPVTILVTKCDLLRGFKSFCRGIPPRLHQEMFGWPNPYALDTGFTSNWIDEAFQSLSRDLQQTQIEVIAEHHLLWDGDGLFLFPASFQALLEPLRVYVNRLFRSSAYHEAFLFRGIYFCGDGELDACEPALLPEQTPSDEGHAVELPSESRWPFAAAAVHRPVFVKHLFERKIFPEYALARPVAKTRLSRNRALVITQSLLAVTALVGGVGIWRAYDRIAADKATILPVLQEIADDLQGLGTAHAQHMAVNATILEDHTVDLLRGMANIRTNRLASVFLPSSWVSSIHHDVTPAITLAYDRIILKNAWFGFARKVHDILNSVPDISSRDASDDNETFIWKIAEFLELQTFVDEVEELELHINIYNNLHVSKKLTDIGEKQKYLFAVELPEDFYQNAAYLSSGLGRRAGLRCDPDRPIIIGTVYNGQQAVPYTLPTEQTKTTLKSNSSKGGGGFNEFRFDDKKDAEEVFIHAQKDMNVQVLNNATATVKQDRTATIQEGNESLVVAKGNRTIQVHTGNEVHEVKGARNLTITGNEAQGSIAIKAGLDLMAKAGTSRLTEAGTSLTNKAGTDLTNQATTSLTNKASALTELT